MRFIADVRRSAALFAHKKQNSRQPGCSLSAESIVCDEEKAQHAKCSIREVRRRNAVYAGGESSIISHKKCPHSRDLVCCQLSKDAATESSLNTQSLRKLKQAKRENARH